jgi:hypothetical protein
LINIFSGYHRCRIVKKGPSFGDILCTHQLDLMGHWTQDAMRLGPRLVLDVLLSSLVLDPEQAQRPGYSVMSRDSFVKQSMYPGTTDGPQNRCLSETYLYSYFDDRLII